MKAVAIILVSLLSVVLCDPPNNNVGGGVFSLGSTTSEVYTYFNSEGPSTRLHPYSTANYNNNFAVSSAITCYYNSTFPSVAVVDNANGKLFTLQGHRIIDSNLQNVNLTNLVFAFTKNAITVNSVTGVNLSYVSTFTVGANTVTYQNNFVVWTGSGQVTVDGLSFTVAVGDTKTTYIFTNWPFANNNTKLIYSTFVGSNGNAVGLVQPVAGGLGAKFTLGSVTYTTPVSVLLGSTNSNLNASAWVDGTTGNDVQALFAYAFGKASVVLYDPLSTLNNGAGTATVSLLTVLICMILAIMHA